MQHNYNYVYQKLVEDEGDIVGHIAYSIYKKQKVEYIKTKEKDGKKINEDDLTHFNHISSTDTAIQNYTTITNLILQDTLDTALSQTIEKIERKVKKDENWSSFWHRVGSGVASAFIFSLIIAAISFIVIIIIRDSDINLRSIFK